ncbi:ABC transporter ATP-binding protein [Thalassospira marina]|uniref:ABC transporter n=1 Tax=Thalassospira marina TaxID=2048283 RepID=A0A2N3KWP7_9PROT|nr:sn-glycerol-3-phosphate ABC transporter ATP-binding protein UgpC [Thalassospira marina]PKR55005.1 ABC transporter [Thalassospira marina]
MANLTISNLKKNYGNVEVLHGLDLTINDGEFVSLIGESGCGKSTLLRMIAGLEEITDGTVAVDGRVINDVAPKDRDMAMVFQNYALYPHLTVAENMGFSLKLRNVPKAEIRPAVEDVAKMLNLSPYLDRLPKALSGGQRQRVAMGRAIVRRPQVFLFDEPLSNLDAKLRVQMRVEIRALQRRLGTTAIYVTHDQMEAMTMSDRIVILNHGKIEQVGAPLEVYDRPANIFVATFIGSPSMNLMDGILERDASGALVRTENALLRVGDAIDAPAGAAVTVGLRPEHLKIAAEGTTGTIPFTLDLIEPTGAETHLYGRNADKPMTVALTERFDAPAGSNLHLAVSPAHVHVFDRENGQRLN